MNNMLKHVPNITKINVMSKTLVTRYILFKDKHLKILIIFLFFSER